MKKDKGSISVADAGRKGGLMTSKRHGPEFYQRIGKKAGETTKLRHGPAHYERIGKMGAKAREKKRREEARA